MIHSSEKISTTSKMKVAVILVVAVVMVVNVEAWGRWSIPRIPPIRLPRIPTIPRIPFPRFPTIPRFRFPRIPGWGKRDVREADADFNAAAEDGILSDDEIISVLGVADEDLVEFKSLYDVNEDGIITIEEFQAVSAIMSRMQEEEEEK